jgi:hypothetical protein
MGGAREKLEHWGYLVQIVGEYVFPKWRAHVHHVHLQSMKVPTDS